MIEILGALAGFAGSTIPNIFKYVQDRSDKKHEIEIMKLQMENAKINKDTMLEAIGIQADITESKELYQTFYTKIKWVDALNGIVRPTLAFSFFILYSYIKICAVMSLFDMSVIWTDVDNAIFLTIISYFFGQRAMQKLIR